jgi:hypothetical protein
LYPDTCGLMYEIPFFLKKKYNKIKMIINCCWQRVPRCQGYFCKFKYCNYVYTVITSVRNVEKAYHTSDFSLTSYHPETKI